METRPEKHSTRLLDGTKRHAHTPKDFESWACQLCNKGFDHPIHTSDEELEWAKRWSQPEEEYDV